MKFYRRLQKNLSLRIINFLSLSIVFACLLLSAGFVKRETSYDRHHAKVDRIARITLQFDGEPVDGRIYGNDLYDILRQIPEIERIVKMAHIRTAVMTYKGTNRVVNDFYMVGNDFPQVFDMPLLQGDEKEALQQKGKIVISERFARQLFGRYDGEEVEMPAVHIRGRQLADTAFIVAGIFKDFPETSHFHADILMHLPDDDIRYTYLLLKNRTDRQALAGKIARLVEERELFRPSKVRVLLTPLSDIHLHSHNLREMSANGNIYHIYLVVGANVLLLIVALFNLWLNESLIFSYNRRYYQLLRLHGAPLSAVFREEVWSALWWGVLSIAAGMSTAFYVSSVGTVSILISAVEAASLSVLFLLSIVAVSLLPTLKSISYTLFVRAGDDLKPGRFSYPNVSYMLTAQYAVVMLLAILAFGVNKQMNLIKNTQAGGNERNILVMNEQPDRVQANNVLLKTELLKHPEIEAVTTAFQLPGDALRDRAPVGREGDTEVTWLPIIVAGDDFLPFFNIQCVAGRPFLPGRYDYQTEEAMMFDYLEHKKQTKHVEEYVINRKALTQLGFAAPEEAVGKMLRIGDETALGYINRGVVVGVTDDFNYTGFYNETVPLLIMQRRVFQGCIMARLDPRRFMQACDVFEKVWQEVKPDYPAQYVFMHDVFDRMYRNEQNAQQLAHVFSLLCFAITTLGLIVFTAFVVRRRTKEIAIRKVHGASVAGIIGMLNAAFIRYIALAFAIAVPLAWYVMHRWMERFVYRTSLDWWIFAAAGVAVLLLSVVSVSWQSRRAANANPAEGIAKA